MTHREPRDHAAASRFQLLAAALSLLILVLVLAALEYAKERDSLIDSLQAVQRLTPVVYKTLSIITHDYITAR